MDVKKQLKNVVWHIETNRKVLGDKNTLDDVLVALKRMASEAESEKVRYYGGGTKSAASKS
ncbi:hypothetical protein CN899_21235 [Bacillus thuringiensis]|uniref:Uncharacterized protein n=1 Tax=Bacillus thuringiensis TaxID=1428 RepID=A0A9X7BXG4_BACTU|nr:hypothetical protein [Bacillus thuringiensis]PGH81067.1 hypothetical protein CN899_21235 [Bacillus thuringiensis]